MMTKTQAFKIIEDYRLELTPWSGGEWSAGYRCSWATHDPRSANAFGKAETLLGAVALCYAEIQAKGIKPEKKPERASGEREI